MEINVPYESGTLREKMECGFFLLLLFLLIIQAQDAAAYLGFTHVILMEA